jgi:hypothetical protein
MRFKLRHAIAAVAALSLLLICGRAVAEPHTVNLIPLIDIKQNVVEGHWTLEDGALVADGSHNAVLALPYDPPDEYDFIIEFTRLSGRDTVAQMFQYGTSQVVWGMGSYSDQLNLDAGNQRLATAIDPDVTRSDVVFTSIVQVRASGITVLLNGTVVAQYKEKVEGAKYPKGWRSLGDARLGLGAWYKARTRFTRVELVLSPSKPGGGVIDPGGDKKPEEPSPTAALHLDSEPDTAALPGPCTKPVAAQATVNALEVYEMEHGMMLGQTSEATLTLTGSATHRQCYAEGGGHSLRHKGRRSDDSGAR